MPAEQHPKILRLKKTIVTEIGAAAGVNFEQKTTSVKLLSKT